MNYAFKNALCASTVFHLALFASFAMNVPSKGLVREKTPLVVDYVKIREVLKAEPYVAPGIPETAPVPIDRKLEMKTVDAKEEPDAQAINKAAEDAKKQAVAEAKLKSTKEYISYYHLIREKIRQNLKNYYMPYHGAGEVALVFTLASDGSVVDCGVENASRGTNRRLDEIAILSVKRSGPFPPFPKALDLARMSFNLTVSFKKD